MQPKEQKQAFERICQLVIEATIANESSDLDRAWARSTEALDLITDSSLFRDGPVELEEPGGYSLTIRCYRNMLRAAIFRGMTEEALELIGKAKQLAGKRNRENETADIYSDCGIIHIMMTNWEEALTCTRQAQEIYFKIDSKEDLARILGNLGIIQLNLGDLGSALVSFREGLHWATTMGNTQLVASMHANLANVYKELADYDDALTSYVKSLELYESLGYVMQSAGIMGNIGLIYYGL